MNLLKNPEEWSNGYWWPPCLPNQKIADFFDEKECYIWYLFTEEGADLELEECANEEQGERPDWFEDEMSMSGTDLYDMYSGCYGNTDSIGQKALWALENGIAPYQPFRIHLLPPRYFKCGGYEYPEEVDVEWDWDVDRTLRISDWDASRRWEHWMMEHRLHKEMMADHHLRINTILGSSPESMWLNWEPYHSSRSYSDGYPDGLRVSLRSGMWIDGRYEQKSWACGRSDDGEREVALKDLLKQAKKALPHIHGNKIRHLPRSPRRKRWEWQRVA